MQHSRATIVFLLMIGFAATAQACSCAYSPPPLKAMAQADAVFSGKVTKIVAGEIEGLGDGSAEGFKFTVKVGKSWKGNVARTVVVETGTGAGDCGFEFKSGGSYLIYAYRTKGGHWATNICLRTQLLKTAANEVLELSGQLPPIKRPPEPPVLELKGKITDAGYAGYVFTLRNRTHERIFYPGDDTNFGQMIQIQKDGEWIDYPPNYDVEPRAELSPKDAASYLASWRQNYREMEPERSRYIDRASRRPIFAAVPTAKTAWRVGFQYLSEREVDAGTKLQDSKHYVWSDPITGTTTAKQLSFKEAFDTDRGEEK